MEKEIRYKEIFGGDDDELSELGDEEELMLGEEEAPFVEEEASEPVEEDEMPYEEEPPSIEKPKKKKLSVASPAEASVRRVIKKGRIERKTRRLSEDRPRRQRKERVQQEEDDERPSVEEPVNPNLAEFDAALSALKGNRKRRVDLQDEAEADEMIIRLCRKMANALEEDLESNHRQQPALAKLRLLPQVTSLLEKSYLHELILDHEVLSLMRQWLEPLADGSLPSLDIRRSFVDALFKLPITSDHLRESRIGRVIMFMYKCEKELPELRKKCGDLIGLWTRPFLNSRQTAATQRPQQDHLSLGSTGPVLHDPDRVRVGDPGYDTKHARIPKAALVEYAAPPSSVVDTGDMQKSAAGSRYRRMASALGRSKSKTDSRLNKVSIEGRGL